MTSDGSDYSYNTTPAISQEQILQEINETYSDYFTVSGSAEYINSFDDCVDTILNVGNTPIQRGDAMVKDLASGYKGWRMADAGEIPDGFAAHPIAIGGVGRVLYADKNIFASNIMGYVGVTKGTMYKVGSNGKLISANSKEDAVVIAIDNTAFCKIKK